MSLQCKEFVVLNTFNIFLDIYPASRDGNIFLTTYVTYVGGPIILVLLHSRGLVYFYVITEMVAETRAPPSKEQVSLFSASLSPNSLIINFIEHNTYVDIT